VVGLAGVIQPMAIPEELMHRDWPLMAILTVSLFLFGYRKQGYGMINRFEGSGLLVVYISYTLYLISIMVNG
jgi:cation:H+ antiporter